MIKQTFNDVRFQGAPEDTADYRIKLFCPICRCKQRNIPTHPLW